jgi:hypothetical protein
MNRSRGGRITASRARRFRRGACTSLAALLLAAVPARGHAQNFAVPPECTDGVSGIDDIFSDFDPIVEVTNQNGAVQVPLTGKLVRNASGWWAPITVTDPKLPHRFLISYTPFLYTDTLITFGRGGAMYVLLPIPGQYSDPLYHLYSTVSITVLQPHVSKPWPLAFLEMAPPFADSDPYTLQADENGVVKVGCFTALPKGNPATVLAPNHSYAYDIDYTFSPTGKDTLTAVSAPRVARTPSSGPRTRRPKS